MPVFRPSVHCERTFVVHPNSAYVQHVVVATSTFTKTWCTSSKGFPNQAPLWQIEPIGSLGTFRSRRLVRAYCARSSVRRSGSLWKSEQRLSADGNKVAIYGRAFEGAF